MDLQINCTEEDIKKYPMHKHDYYEIMFYLQGTGYMKTEIKNYPFSKGSIIIIPPGIEHGSVSERGFKNISLGGNFEHLLCLENPVTISDNDRKEGETLIKLIYHNKFSAYEYLSKLCSAYICFLMQNINLQGRIASAVNKIVSEISDNFCDCNINIGKFLEESGYAKDYLRCEFKRITGRTPNGFLTEIRINHACFLIGIYSNNMSLSQIAERCGYTDYVYFSKKFKIIKGMSPLEYRNRNLKRPQQ